MNRYTEILSRNPIVAAPLADVTDYPCRRILREYTDGLIHTEMVAVQGLLHDSARTWRMIETVPSEPAPVGIQILGAEDLHVAASIRRIAEVRSEVIDINMACPVRKVLKSDCGAALLDDPDRAARLVRAVRQESDRPVGVKIRLGLREITAERVVEAVAEAGAEAVTIHGRTAEQLYRGKSDRERVLAIARSSPIPIIAAGDNFTVDDVRECLQGGAAGALIARGMMGRPWFLAEAIAAVRQLPPPAPADRVEVILRHLAYVLEWDGPEGLRKFRRHLVEYVRGLPGASQLRHALVTAESADRVREILLGMGESAERQAARV